MAYKAEVDRIEGKKAECYRYNMREILKAKKNIWDGLEFMDIAWGTYHMLEINLKVSRMAAKKIMNAYTKLKGESHAKCST